MSDKALIKVTDLKKHYNGGDVKALDGVNFEVKTGERISLIGENGSGKSTILNIMGGMDLSTSGDYFVEEKNIACLKIILCTRRKMITAR